MFLYFPAFLRQYCQCFVLVSLHDFAFSGAFVVDAAAVEDTVNDGTVEFLIVGGVESFGISLYRVEADKQVSGDLVATGIVERDDIRIIIMLKVLADFFQYFFLRGGEVVCICHFLSLFRGYHFFPHADCFLFLFRALVCLSLR